MNPQFTKDFTVVFDHGSTKDIIMNSKIFVQVLVTSSLLFLIAVNFFPTADAATTRTSTQSRSSSTSSASINTRLSKLEIRLKNLERKVQTMSRNNNSNSQIGQIQNQINEITQVLQINGNSVLLKSSGRITLIQPQILKLKQVLLCNLKGKPRLF